MNFIWALCEVFYLATVQWSHNDVMVLKAGMRERRDAPGTLSRNILIIAPIGIDHTDYLNKIEIEIAGKKTVITSENSKLTLAPQLSDAYRKIVDCAKENGLKFEYINGNYDKNNQT